MPKIADWLGIHVDWAWYLLRLLLILWPIILLIALPSLVNYWPTLWQIAGWTSFLVGLVWPFRVGNPSD